MATAEDKLRWGGGGDARLLALGPPSGVAAGSVVAKRSWILNYVIFPSLLYISRCIRSFYLTFPQYLASKIQLLFDCFVVIGQ